MDLPTKNTGLIEGSGTKNLYLAGTLPYEARLKTGDWRPFLPVGEKQFRKDDFMDCVTFSDLSDIEIQAKFLTGQEPNFSDRFIAKLSGTTHEGNYLDKVADTVRKTGLVREEEWPTADNDTWDSYYAPVPQDVIDKAVKFDIAYEGIGTEETSLLYHLKQCPIQITLPLPYPNHAVVLVAIENGLAYYFDSYPGTTNYLKTIPLNKIAYALKIVLKGTMNQTKIVVGKDGKTVYKCIPIAEDFANFKKQAGVEGIVIPDPIPKADTL